MALELEFLDAALEDAASAAQWYSERNTAAAQGFADEIDAAVSAIARTPGAWPFHAHGTHRYLLRRYPFSVIYRIEPRRVLILAVAHASRRPGYWRLRIAGCIRVGRFHDFNGADTLLIEVDEEGLASLIERTTNVGETGRASFISQWPDAVSYGSISVAAERSVEDAGLAVVSDREFIWRRSAAAWADVAEKLRAMQNHGPCHQYLDGPADDLVVMVAIGEYGQAWWETHGR